MRTRFAINQVSVKSVVRFGARRRFRRVVFAKSCVKFHLTALETVLKRENIRLARALHISTHQNLEPYCKS